MSTEMNSEKYKNVEQAVLAVRAAAPTYLRVGRLHIDQEVYDAACASLEAAEAWIKNPTDEAAKAAKKAANKVGDLLQRMEEDGWYDPEPYVYATAAVAWGTAEERNDGSFFGDFALAALRRL